MHGILRGEHVILAGFRLCQVHGALGNLQWSLKFFTISKRKIFLLENKNVLLQASLGLL